MLKIFVSLLSVTLVAKYTPTAAAQSNSENTKNMPVVKFRSAAEAEAAGVTDYVLDFMGLVECHGYPAEEHRVVTDDGYNLRLHRIPGSPSSPPAANKSAVLLQHGVMGSSDLWVLTGPQTALPFILADNGYDVWLGNARGNTYSRSHETLNASSPKFWDFSFHEVGVYDLASMIDYILLNTNEKRLHYVGHSMGTTVSYVLLSERPDYNEKMKLVVSLAPVAFWKHRPNGLKFVVRRNSGFVQDIIKHVNVFEILPQSRELPEWAQIFCNGYANPCKLIAMQIAGDGFTVMNSTFLSYVLNYYPAGGSTKTVMHFHQNMKTGKFHKFDEGPFKNFDNYGQIKPLAYDVTKITAPVALIYAMNDPISTRKDTKYLSNILPNVVTCEPVPWDKFNHIDFHWAHEAKQLVHDRIIELMKKFEY